MGLHSPKADSTAMLYYAGSRLTVEQVGREIMTKTAARSYQEFWDNQDATPRVLLHRAAYKWAIHTGAYKKVSENLDDPCAAILQAYLSSGDS